MIIFSSLIHVANSHSASNKDPFIEKTRLDCLKKGDTDCANFFNRAQDIHLCQATKSFETKDGRYIEAMSEEEVKEWIYYNHLYPKNCSYY